MNSQKSIQCLGIMVADVIGRPVRAIPDPGRLVLVDEMSLHTGGCAINTATALRRLDLPVEVIGKVGTDPFGDFILNVLMERGIGIGGVKRDPTVGTSATMVMVEPDGERRFIHYLGANKALTLTDIDFQIITTASILDIAGSLVMPGIDGEPTAELLQIARSAGVTTFLDVVWDDTGRWMKVLAPCLPHIDYFLPSLPEAQAITGLEVPLEVARALVDHGVGTVGLKMGQDGCLVLDKAGNVIRLPAFKVNVIDATGAGDAFVAGFIAATLRGFDPFESAALANAVAASCVSTVGASTAIKTFDHYIAHSR